jgi:hypothetical protein
MIAKGLGATWIRTFAILAGTILLPFSVLIGILSDSWFAAVVALGCGALVLAALALRAALVIRADQITLGFTDWQFFLRAVDATLPSVGYRPLSGNTNVFVAKPAGLGFLAPVIYVVMGNGSATFNGPRERVRRLAWHLTNGPESCH